MPQTPLSDSTPKLVPRNAEIRIRYQQGESLHSLAESFGITYRDVWLPLLPELSRTHVIQVAEGTKPKCRLYSRLN